MSPSLICANPEIRGLVRSFDAIVGAFVYELRSRGGLGSFERLQDRNTINALRHRQSLTAPQRLNYQFTVKFTGVDLT
jgi:hypothetical protein